jgi:CRP/FNR family transcriptional regulator, cyclic AMP receptor protein
LKSRFEGDEGRRRLLELLMDQRAVGHDEALARRLADAADIREHAEHEVLILQGDGGNDVAFLLMGSVDILVNEQPVASRSAGEHVGEMAAIDLKAKRSATVRAREAAVAAWVPEAKLAAIAQEHPSLWRGFARMLGDRLRERGRLVRSRNAKPRVFVGSSVEGLAVAQALQKGLSHDPVLVRVWPDDVFAPSSYTANDLLAEAERSDFAVFVIRGDDVTKSRGAEAVSPRDNVIFELGLFMGALGRERTLVVRPRGAGLKVPSDLLGLRALDYDDTVPPPDLAAVLGTVCTEIREVARRLGAR